MSHTSLSTQPYIFIFYYTNIHRIKKNYQKHRNIWLDTVHIFTIGS